MIFGCSASRFLSTTTGSHVQSLRLLNDEGPRSRPNCRTRFLQPSPKIEHKQRQWNVFLENVALHPGSAADVIAAVAGCIMPHAIAAAKIGRNR